MNERSNDHPTSDRRALLEALRKADDRAAPDAHADLWPSVRDRVQASPGRRSSRSRHRIGPAPSTRAGWVLATLITLLVMTTGAYATGGIMDVLDGIFGKTVPYIQEHELGEPVGEKISREGVTVTIDRVYADSHYVVVGYDIEGLDNWGEDPNDWDTDLVAGLTLSEPDGKTIDKKFVIVDSFQRSGAEDALQPAPPPGSEVGTFVFESSERWEAGEEHSFRVGVDIFRPMESDAEPVGGPFFFDLRVSVKEAPAIEVDQTVEAGGVPVTLKRVVNSPVRTNAYLCFDPPEGGYDWPWAKTGLHGEARQASTSVYHSRPPEEGAVEEGCATFTYPETLYDKPGTHRLTVTELRPSSPDGRGSVKGPWRFDFVVPEPQAR